jgi:transposase-like protein
MFSYEERMKAVKLLIKYDMSYSDVMRELGYPSRKALSIWYKEYLQTGDLHKKHLKKYKFTDEDKQKAVNHYLEHGRCISRTVRILGYPSRTTLDNWVKEMTPEKKKYCHSGNSLVKYTQKQKEQAVISLCLRNKPAREVAADIGVPRETLYNWKRQLLNKGSEKSMSKKTKSNNSNDIKEEVQAADLLKEKELLEKQVDKLQQEISRLQLERD